jgi:hypothetical protein
MAQQLQPINLVAPGFKGVNTEDSPLSIDANFASIADNCVIDRYGRLAARKGYSVLTETATELGSAAVEVIEMFRDSAGNTKLFSCGNNKILSGTTTLVDETPSAYTITDNNWDVVNFNDSIYFFQRDYEPLVYSNASAAVEPMSSVSGAAGTPPEGNVVLAAWGRLWVADFDNDKSTIYWSDLLQGHVWSGGSSGSIDISKVWPDGYDEITGLAATNNFLIIFGKHSIVVYSGANSPASMELSDTVSGIGIRCRCGVVDTGTDLLFLSYDGLRSFGRTIQEKSLPIGDLSRNIKQDLLKVIGSETQPVRIVYSPENSFVLLVFRSQSLAYCFDVRGTLENGSYRVTRWPAVAFKALHRDTTGTLYTGTIEGIGTYSGYTDNGESYLLKYYSPNLTFGDASKLKILKKMRPTVIGGSGLSVGFKWGYEFFGAYSTFNVTLSSASIAEYGVGEFGISEFSSGVVSRTLNINTTGNGTSVVVGMEANITTELSLQEYNIWTMIGKMA